MAPALGKRKRGDDDDDERAAGWRLSPKQPREACGGAPAAGARDASDAELARMLGLPPPPPSQQVAATAAASGKPPPLTLEQKAVRLLGESEGSLVPAADWRPESRRLRELHDGDGAPRSCPYPSFLHAVYWVKLPAAPDGARPACLDVLRVTAKASAACRGAPPTSYDAVYPHPTRAGWWGVPRAWGLSTFGTPREDKRALGEPMAAGLALNTASRPLRPDQLLAVDRLLATLRDWGLAFLEADCGFGKSATVFEVCRVLGRKTLYVVSERENMDQTRDNLLGTPTVYGWVPRARVGSLRESWEAAQRARPGTKAAAKCDWQNKDFVVASTKSLLECGYPPHVLASFGTWVFDEADVAAAETVRHLAAAIPARYVLGVSATPDRRDGLQHVIHWLLGPAAFVYKRLAWVTGRRGTVRVIQVRGDGWTFQPVIYRRSEEFAFQETARVLSGIPERNAFIVELVRDALVQGRRKVLVFSLFTEHVDTLAALVRGVLTPAVVPADSVVVMHGKMSAGALDAAKVRAKEDSTRVLLTSYAKLAKGWDDPHIDCEVLALPKSDVRQIVGRVEREAKDKQIPEVYDIVDDYGIYFGMARSRRAFYTTKAFDVQYATATVVAGLMERRRAAALDAAQPLTEALECPAAARAR